MIIEAGKERGMFYYSLNDYLKNRFGCKVYKLALSANVTCPNRDGTKGTRGCIFCSGGGSGEFAADSSLSIAGQIEQAKTKIQNKTGANAYIAYFQSYTNTYAETGYLEEIFSQAISHKEVAALSIATRPDCLAPGVISLIERLARIKPVFVELGLQTIHEKTARYIRRGYPLSCFNEAVARLRSVGALTVVHVILGLPFETRGQMLETVSYVGKSGVHGIKLQLLHVLEGTDLALAYRDGLFETLSQEEYIDLLCECVELLPEDMVIHRLTGDGAKKLLIAPLWSGNKRNVLNSIQKTFRERDVVQGSKYVY